MTTHLENVKGCESAPTVDHGAKSAACDAYNPGDHSYSNIFTSKATCDSSKSDTQLNAELNCHPCPYDSQNSGFGDIQNGLKSDDSAKSDLQKAMDAARNGDTTSAMKQLRQASGDLNTAGGSYDSAMSNFGDDLKDDKFAKRLMNKGFDDGDKADDKIERAERMLRRGDTQGAIRAMSGGIGQIENQEYHMRKSSDRLTQDDQLSSELGDDQYPDRRPTQRPGSQDLGTTPSGLDQGSAPTFPFDGTTPLSGLPNPSDVLNGLPKPPNPLDIFSGLPQPPNPFDMFGGLPTPPNPSDLLNDLPQPPSPSDLLNGLGSIAQNPLKPIENLLTPPDISKPQDVIKKIFDPFGIF